MSMVKKGFLSTEYLSIQQAHRDYFKQFMKLGTLYNNTRDNTIPCVYIGKRRYIKKSVIEDIFAEPDFIWKGPGF